MRTHIYCYSSTIIGLTELQILWEEWSEHPGPPGYGAEAFTKKFEVVTCRCGKIDLLITQIGISIITLYSVGIGELCLHAGFGSACFRTFLCRIEVEGCKGNIITNNKVQQKCNCMGDEYSNITNDVRITKDEEGRRRTVIMSNEHDMMT